MSHIMNQSAEAPTAETNISLSKSSETVLTKTNFIQYHASEALFVYVPPFILLFGVTGNVLAAIVMSRRRMRISPSVLYIRIIAVADTFVLIVGCLPKWIRGLTHVDITRLSEWICKSRKFIFYGAGDVSVWLLTAFTIDRFIAVCFPLHKKHLCTHRRIRIITVIVLIIAVAVNLHLFWTFGIEYEYKNGTAMIHDVCGHPTPAIKHFSRNIRPWIVLIYYSLIPFAIIITCNGAIIRVIVRMRRKDVGKAIAEKDLKKAQQQASVMTAMALLISFALLLLTTPGIVIYSIKQQIPKDGYSQAAYSLAKVVGDLLMYTNHSVNFYLYCLTGTKFRQEFKSLFRKRRSSQDDSSTTTTAMRNVSIRNTTSATVVN